MMRLLHKNNKAYSLVEMLIVLAIIGIAATISLISITVINSARAKEASVVFDSEVANIITKSKNMTPDNDPNKCYALVMYNENNKIKVCQAVYDKSTKSYTYDEDSLVTFSSRVSVSFDGSSFKAGTDPEELVADYSGGSAVKDKGDEAVFIRFDKKGRCVSGYGTFKFYKKNGNQIARVTIRQNGSHESK